MEEVDDNGFLDKECIETKHGINFIVILFFMFECTYHLKIHRKYDTMNINQTKGKLLKRLGSRFVNSLYLNLLLFFSFPCKVWDKCIVSLWSYLL